MDFGLYPHIYKTGHLTGLRSMLEEIWPNNRGILGSGTFYIISAYANFNGGARFYKCFREHTEKGGEINIILGGSAAQRTASRQVTQALLDCGAKVWVTNRKSLMHAKLYGYSSKTGDALVVTSGNFTGPGMSRNVEAAILLSEVETKVMEFSWSTLFRHMLSQSWPTHPVGKLSDVHPAWPLLYDEKVVREVELVDELGTMILILGHADTARIMAAKGSKAARGTQYFWLSKDCFDFFPPLTIRNVKGYKGTLSALIRLEYVDLGKVDEARVTFEAENNLDFRLGTGLLRGTKSAAAGDVACISRITEDRYQLRIYRKGSRLHGPLSAFASDFIGTKEKRYGIISNENFETVSGVKLAES